MQKSVLWRAETMIRLRHFAILIFAIAVLEFAFFGIYRHMTADHKGPVLKVDEDELVCSVKDGDEKLLDGVKARDDHDGDLSDQVMVENISNFTGDGKRIVTYVVADSSNHVSRATRTISYRDYDKPRFEVKTAPRFSVAEVDSKSDYAGFVKATDLIDGNITKNVKISSVEDYKENEYGGFRDVVFQVSNSAGDTSTLPVTISYTETGAPAVNLSSYVVYLKKNAGFNPGEYMASVEMGNSKYSVADFREAQKGSIDVRNNINTKEPGMYSVEYAAKAANGKTSVTYMKVIVEE